MSKLVMVRVRQGARGGRNHHPLRRKQVAGGYLRTRTKTIRSYVGKQHREHNENDDGIHIHGGLIYGAIESLYRGHVLQFFASHAFYGDEKRVCRRSWDSSLSIMVTLSRMSSRKTRDKMPERTRATV